MARRLFQKWWSAPLILSKRPPGKSARIRALCRCFDSIYGHFNLICTSLISFMDHFNFSWFDLQSTSIRFSSVSCDLWAISFRKACSFFVDLFNSVLVIFDAIYGPLQFQTRLFDCDAVLRFDLHTESMRYLHSESIRFADRMIWCTAHPYLVLPECAHAHMLKRFPACSSERLSWMEEAGSRSSPIPVRGDQDEVCPMCTTAKSVIFFVCCRCGLFYTVWDCKMLQKWRESSMRRG